MYMETTQHNTFKKILAPLLAALMAFALIGCGGGEPQTGLEQYGIDAAELQELEEEIRNISPEELQRLEDEASAITNGG